MATIITLIASVCLIMIAIRIKVNNSKKAKKDAVLKSIGSQQKSR